MFKLTMSKLAISGAAAPAVSIASLGFVFMLTTSAFGQAGGAISPPAAKPTTQPAAVSSTPAADLKPAREILDLAIEAMGGKEAYASVKSLKYRFNILNPEGAGVTTFDIKRMGFKRVHIVETGVRDVRTLVRTKDLAWIKHPDIGIKFYSPRHATTVTNLDTYGAFLSFNDPAWKYETQPSSIRNDVECWKIKATSPDGFPSWLFFDMKSGVPVGLDQVHETGGSGTVGAQLILGDHAKVGPITLFKSARIQSGPDMKSECTYSNIEFNTVSSATFVVPEDVRRAQRAWELELAREPESEDEADKRKNADAYRSIANSVKAMNDPAQIRMLIAVLHAKLPGVPDADKANMEKVIELCEARLLEVIQGG